MVFSFIVIQNIIFIFKYNYLDTSKKKNNVNVIKNIKNIKKYKFGINKFDFAYFSRDYELSFPFVKLRYAC